MVAPFDQEVPPAVGEGALVDVLDPGAELAERNAILCLARHRAGVAANALALVDDEAQARHLSLLPSRTQRPDAGRRLETSLLAYDSAVDVPMPGIGLCTPV